MKRLFAAISFAAALAGAGSAQAEPRASAPLEFLGRTDQFSYFVANDPQLRTGAGFNVWVLAALDRITPTTDGDRIAGAWLRMEIDCAARTLAVRESMLIRDDYSITEHSDDTDPSDVARDDSPYGVLRDYMCSGKALDPEIHARDLADALGLARSLGSDEAPERRLPERENRT